MRAGGATLVATCLLCSAHAYVPLHSRHATGLAGRQSTTCASRFAVTRSTPVAPWTTAVAAARSRAAPHTGLFAAPGGSSSSGGGSARFAAQLAAARRGARSLRTRAALLRAVVLAWLTKARRGAAVAAAAVLLAAAVAGGGGGAAAAAGGADAAAAYSTWTPGQTVPDLSKNNPGSLPNEQWEMRDKLHGVMHDTSIDKTAYRLPRDADYLTKGALYGKALSSSAPEQMVFERKYWLMRTSAAEGGDSMVAILQAVGAGLSISAVFAGVVAIMRKFISLAEEEEEQLYGTKLEVDATELEPDEVVQLSGLEDDDGQSDEGSDARPPLPESPQAPPGGADDDDDLL